MNLQFTNNSYFTIPLEDMNCFYTSIYTYHVRYVCISSGVPEKRGKGRDFPPPSAFLGGSDGGRGVVAPYPKVFPNMMKN